MGGRHSAEGTDEPWALRNAAWIVSIGALLTVGVASAALLILPYVDALAGDYTGVALQQERADIRRSGLAIATALAATAAGLLAWGRLELARREHNQRRQEFDLDGDRRDQENRNERFGRAVELLGSPDVSVRLGGLYALEGLAQDDSERARTIYDVIAAFVRGRSPEMRSDGAPLPVLQPDYEAGLTVALRRQDPMAVPIDLSGTVIAHRQIESLVNVGLANACLRNCRLDGARIENAILAGATLTSCTFVGAQISSSAFEEAELDQCRLSGATIRETSFRRASITDCMFSDAAVTEGARFEKCPFGGATIRRCRFDGADFEDCNFGEIFLSAAAILVSYAKIFETSFQDATFKNCGFKGVEIDRATKLWDSQVDLSQASRAPDAAVPEEAEYLAPEPGSNEGGAEETDTDARTQ